MIDFTRKRQGRARAEKVDVRQMAVAELMAWGWDSFDAMLVVGLLKETDTKLDAQHTAVNYTASDEFDAFYKKRVKQMRNGVVLDEYQKPHPTPGTPAARKGRMRLGEKINDRPNWLGPLDEPVPDEEILAAMWETITKLDPKDPKRVDLLDKYDKLKRRQGIGEDDTTIHFYLPRPECDACPFRGGHVISEPEDMLKLGIDPPEEQPEPPKQGYSKNGKKLGRPPKKRRKKHTKAEDTVEHPVEDLIEEPEEE